MTLQQGVPSVQSARGAWARHARREDASRDVSRVASSRGAAVRNVRAMMATQSYEVTQATHHVLQLSTTTFHYVLLAAMGAHGRLNYVRGDSEHVVSMRADARNRSRLLPCST